jgi:hypothetical protein
LLHTILGGFLVYYVLNVVFTWAIFYTGGADVTLKLIVGSLTVGGLVIIPSLIAEAIHGLIANWNTVLFSFQGPLVYPETKYEPRDGYQAVDDILAKYKEVPAEYQPLSLAVPEFNPVRPNLDPGYVDIDGANVPIEIVEHSGRVYVSDSCSSVTGAGVTVSQAKFDFITGYKQWIKTQRQIADNYIHEF